MKSLVKAYPKKGIWLKSSPIPVYGYNDVLIKIKKTAICGTDMHIYHWDQWSQKTIPTPMVIGHEFVGEIIAFGEGVTRFKIGDKVSGEGHITCESCRNCRAGKRHLCRNTKGVGVNRMGAFAEYLSIPAVNAFKLPDDIDDDLGAILDPFGNAVHTALSFNLVGEDVLITGAGPIGIMVATIAQYVGARHVVITDINDYRLDLAKKMGKIHPLNVKKNSLESLMNQLGMLEGFDVGLEVSGAPSAIQSMISVMNHGGKMALLGIPGDHISIDFNPIVFKGLQIKGIYGREMFETWYKMISLLQSGLILDPIITHRYSIDDFQEGFDQMASGKSGKIILEW
jgi:threonine 3-dehydrogenase